MKLKRLPYHKRLLIALAILVAVIPFADNVSELMVGTSNPVAEQVEIIEAASDVSSDLTIR